MPIFHRAGLMNVPSQIKATGGRLLGLNIGNTAAAARFVKFFDKATTPVMGTDIPVLTVSVGATGATSWPAMQDATFAAGIWVACTGAIADTDNTAPVATDVVVSGTYV